MNPMGSAPTSRTYLISAFSAVGSREHYFRIARDTGGIRDRRRRCYAPGYFYA